MNPAIMRKAPVQLCWLAAAIPILAVGLNGALCGSKMKIANLGLILWLDLGERMLWLYYLALLALVVCAVIGAKSAASKTQGLFMRIGFVASLVPLISSLYALPTLKVMMDCQDIVDRVVWLGRMAWQMLPLPFVAAAIGTHHPKRRLGYLALSISAMAVALFFSYQILHLSWCDKPHGVFSMIAYWFLNAAIAWNGIRLVRSTSAANAPNLSNGPIAT